MLPSSVSPDRKLSPALLLILGALVACIAIPILTWPYFQGPPVVVTFTSAVQELGTTETGRQNINLGRIKQPGRYILQLANDTPPFSEHWLEWDYLALKAGGSFIWQIGQDETPLDYNYTGQATDEFCGTAACIDCRTGFEVVAGKIDERNFPKTLNDGEFPVIRIAFTVTQEQTGADLVLTLSTLYSSHLPDTRDFRMQVTLQGPF